MWEKCLNCKETAVHPLYHFRGGPQHLDDFFGPFPICFNQKNSISKRKGNGQTDAGDNFFKIQIAPQNVMSASIESI